MIEKIYVRPFSNGSEYDDWTAKNCMNCERYEYRPSADNGCILDIELAVGFIGAGEIDIEVAKRIGIVRQSGKFVTLGDCKEKMPKGEYE